MDWLDQIWKTEEYHLNIKTLQLLFFVMPVYNKNYAECMDNKNKLKMQPKKATGSLHIVSLWWKII